MNEPLFKNRFVRDESTAKELYKNYYLSGKHRTIYIILLVLLPLSFIISFDEGLGTFLYILLCTVLIAVMVAVAYRKNVKMTLERDRERANGQEPINELTVYEDSVEIEIFGSKQTLDLANIHHASITKNYVNVFSKAQFIYIFKKDSFTLGNAEDFIEFLKSKGIKVQK